MNQKKTSHLAFPFTQATILPFKKTSTVEVTPGLNQALSLICKTHAQAQLLMTVFHQHVPYYLRTIQKGSRFLDYN